MNKHILSYNYMWLILRVTISSWFAWDCSDFTTEISESQGPSQSRTNKGSWLLYQYYHIILQEWKLRLIGCVQNV